MNRNEQQYALYAIIATCTETGQQVECFTWQGSPHPGIERAMREAKENGKNLSQYRAIPISAPFCVGCGD